MLKYVEACEVITDVRRARVAPRGAIGKSATGGSDNALTSATNAAVSVLAEMGGGSVAAMQAAGAAAQKLIEKMAAAAVKKQSRADLPELERTASELGRLLRLFQDGVVILDEVSSDASRTDIVT